MTDYERGYADALQRVRQVSVFAGTPEAARKVRLAADIVEFTERADRRRNTGAGWPSHGRDEVTP